MKSHLSTDVFWANGEIRPFSESRISVYNTAIVHGDAVCEMLRTFRHQPFQIEKHLARLRHSVEAALLTCPHDNEELVSALNEVLANNTSRIENRDDLGIIIFVTAGLNFTYTGKLKFADRFNDWTATCIHTFPLHFELWRDSLREGQHLVVAPRQAVPPECMDPTIKSRSRMHWRIADRLVKRDHPGATAVLADADGNLTETSSANLFVLREGEVLTPPADRVLNGISRQVVMELAEAAGYRVKEQTIPVELALEADEIWTTSTPYCMLPVTRFNETEIADGKPGPVFEQILDAWSEMVDVDLREQICN